MFAAAHQITGWSGWRGSLLSLSTVGVFREGYAGVSAGPERRQQRWGGEL